MSNVKYFRCIFFQVNPLKCSECVCMHQGRERERERPYWKEGQGTKCFHRLSSQQLRDQTAFLAHTLSKPAHYGMLNIIILLSMLTNMKFTINQMQKWKFCLIQRRLKFQPNHKTTIHTYDKLIILVISKLL